MDNNNENQLSFDIKPEVAKGNYSNLAIITHSHSEFIIDFATILPAMPKGEVISRMVMTPEHAKRLMFALNENIRKYEDNFGPIELQGQPQQKGGTFNIADFGPLGGTKN